MPVSGDFWRAVKARFVEGALVQLTKQRGSAPIKFASIHGIAYSRRQARFVAWPCLFSLSMPGVAVAAALSFPAPVVLCDHRRLLAST